MLTMYTVRVLAVSTDAWVAGIFAVLAPLITAFSVITYKAVRQLQAERKGAPFAERTVAIDEMESLARMWRETLRQKNEDYEECHQQLDSCQKRWWDHIKVCPMWGSGRGSGT